MLIQTLVPPAKGKRYNHQKGCRNVSREMSEKDLKDKFAVGIIDKDKREVDYLKQFQEIARYKDDLILYAHKTKLQFFIQICPAIEKWILNICDKEKINLNEHNLPDKLYDLTKITKSQNSSHDERFLSLFTKLKNSNSAVIKKICELDYAIKTEELSNRYK
jgi:hypothetical protein